MAILKVENLGFSYSSGFTLGELSFEVKNGEFVIVCGETGCGKSTLLKLLKREVSPKGKGSGKIYYDNVDIDLLDEKKAAFDIGFVTQNPDNQLISDSVWHELAFSLECKGEKSEVIKRRLAEVCGFFGITNLFSKKTFELSEGQKQLVNLAAVIAPNPKLLLLDEPTSRLDPIAASEFIFNLYRINREFGTSIILTEHNLVEALPLADRIILLSKGKKILDCHPRELSRQLCSLKGYEAFLQSLPYAVRLLTLFDSENEGALSIKDARRFFSQRLCANALKTDCNVTDKSNSPLDNKNPENEQKLKMPLALSARNIYYRYKKNEPDILSGLNLDIYSGEILTILGGNGSGKTTLFKLLCGLYKAWQGKIKLIEGAADCTNYVQTEKKSTASIRKATTKNRVFYLPQNPQTVFVCDTVDKELFDAAFLAQGNKENASKAVMSVLKELNLSHLIDCHPYDLSGGEQQLTAFAKMLLNEPQIFLLDEPTKGMDFGTKNILINVIKRLKNEGKTIVIITHDIELAAAISDRCAMLFDGRIVSINEPKKFFIENIFYTTQAHRITMGIVDNVVMWDELRALCELEKQYEK